MKYQERETARLVEKSDDFHGNRGSSHMTYFRLRFPSLSLPYNMLLVNNLSVQVMYYSTPRYFV